MPVFLQVPVVDLVEPENPQRITSSLERIDELRDSIRQNGLQQPIGVERLPEGKFRIIWGHRRSIAVTQLGWLQIPAMVYELGEADPDALMGAENYHRTQTNDMEEALYYKRILPKYPEGTMGMSRELNVPMKRIEDLLLLAEGDPDVFALLGERKLSMAQAMQVNKFASPGYRKQATEMAVRDGTSADRLRLWRRDVQRQGLDKDAEQRQVTWSTPLPGQGEIPMGHCQIGNHEVPLMLRKVYDICNEHYNVFLQGLEALGREVTLQEAGLYHHIVRLLKVAEGQGEVDNGTVRSGSTGGS